MRVAAVIALGLTAWALPAEAQNMALTYGVVGSSSIDGGGTDAQGALDTLSLQGGFPIVLDGGDWVLLPGLLFERFGFYGRDDVAAYGFGASFVVFHRLSDVWGLALQTSLTHHSDLGGSDANAWGGTFSAIARRRLSEDHTLGFGGALTYRQGRWLPVPVVRWLLRTKRWTVDVLAPARALVALRLTEDVELGPQVHVGGGGASLTGLGLSTRMVNVAVGLTARYRIAGPIYAFAFGGATVFHRFQVDRDAGASATVFKTPAPTFSVGVRLVR
ncbi:MAG: DUF6268 family outer membrane beta-barrel protein [Deltaproteobacteria bacterium]